MTSPPYRNAIDYSADVENDGQWFRGTGSDTTSSYLDAMAGIFHQVHEATEDGGFCCIIIGDEVSNGKLISLPSLLLSRLAASENDDRPGMWRFRDMIIWHKVTSGRNGSGNRFGVFIQHAYPGYYRANIMHEYVLILQKGGGSLSQTGEGIPLNRIMKREIANSIWNIPPVPPGMVRHPAPFPEQIPWRLITLFTRPGDMVMDPMNGSGQTTKVARHTGRRYLGFDVRGEYVEEARKRMFEPLHLSDYLIPVYYRETWSKTTQPGFFETDGADLTPNVPAGYRPVCCMGRGGADMYAYYANGEGRLMCFVMAANGKQYRIMLGATGERGTVLERAFSAMPGASFTETEMREAVGEGCVAGRTRTARACIGALIHVGQITETGRPNVYATGSCKAPAPGRTVWQRLCGP